MNSSIKRSQDVVDLLNTYRPNITALEQDVIAYTKVQLDGRAEVCRSQECNLGNLITDSMVHARVMERQNKNYWTDAPIAFLMSGGKYQILHIIQYFNLFNRISTNILKYIFITLSYGVYEKRNKMMINS